MGLVIYKTTVSMGEREVGFTARAFIDYDLQGRMRSDVLNFWDYTITQGPVDGWQYSKVYNSPYRVNWGTQYDNFNYVFDWLHGK